MYPWMGLGSDGPGASVVGKAAATDGIVFSLSSYVEALTASVTVFGNKVFRRQLRFHEDIRMGSYCNKIGGLMRRGKEFSPSLSLPCEDTTRRWPSMSQEDSSHRHPTTPPFSSQPSSLQNCWKRIPVLLSHPSMACCRSSPAD